MNEPQSNLDPTRTADAGSLPSATATGSNTLGTPGGPGPAPPFVGEYAIVGELGRGGMGVVYRAEDGKLKREVALKVMLPQFATNPQAKARFVREARAQAKVEHDHVAAIHRVDEHDGLPYLVMPLLKGMTLHAALRANPQPPLMEVIRIGREVAEGLAAAHEQGLVHRDIKPANVWLEGKKLRVKILDFGLARVADTDGTDATDGPVTREGAVVGTPAYMSPEQGRGLAVDGRTDLWSLGVMLYQMTTGELPFRGPTTLAILTSLAIDNPPPPFSVNPSVPQQLSHLIMRLLAKDPAYRPPTAEAAAEELRAIEASLVNAVRVIPLDSPPPLILGSAEPDPFADLDATEANSAPEAEPAEEDVPEAAAVEIGKRRGFPMWAMVGGVLLAVVGIVGVVLSQMGMKPPEVAKEPPKDNQPVVMPVVPKPPDPLPPSDPTFFNGKDLTGWEMTPGIWKVENSEIVGASSDLSKGQAYSFLRTSRMYSDFELAFEVKVGNQPAGFNFRGRCDTLHAKEPGLVMGQDWSLWLGRERLGNVNPKVHDTVKPGEYVALQLRCLGKRVSLLVNGVTAIDDEFDIPLAGKLGWVFKQETDKLRIRNIRFTDLSGPPPVTAAPAGDFKPLFNGKDLSGWNLSGRPKTEVVTEAGRQAIRIKPTDEIRSTASYRDFHLKVDYLTLTPGTVAAVVYRSGKETFSFNMGADGLLNALGNCDAKPGEIKDGRVVAKNLPPAHGIPAVKGELRPAGQWNTLEVIAIGDTAVHVLNGKVVCVGADLRVNGVPSAEGALRLACTSGGDVVFSNIVIREIKALPEEFGGPKAADRERAVALWVLERGGEVTINGTTVVKDRASLPAGPFKLTRVHFMDVKLPFGDADVARLADAPNLLKLEVWHGKHTDTGVLKLLAMPFAAQLTELALEGGATSDESVKPIAAKCLALKSLSLKGSRVTDEGIPALAALPKLELVNLGATKVTDEGAKRLAKLLPKCRIAWGNDQLIEPRKP